MELWLIDDDDVDRESFIRCMRQLAPHIHVTASTTAEAALQRLHQQAPHGLPFALVLDLYLPRMSGFAFLQQVRQDTILRSLAVFVLTGSNAQQDRVRAQAYRVAGYLYKDQRETGCQELLTLLQQLADYSTTT